jgi:hypothetical protein
MKAFISQNKLTTPNFEYQKKGLTKTKKHNKEENSFALKIIIKSHL